MKQNTITIDCAICGATIIKEINLTKSLVELAEQHNLPEITLRHEGINSNGYLCGDCFHSLKTKDPLKKITKRAVNGGNAAVVTLPKKWVGRKVIVFSLVDT